MKRILFICLGNIIRSPLAEYIFKDIVKNNRTDGQFFIDSAGTSAYHIGKMADLRMRSIAAENGIVYTGKGKQFSLKDFNNFDLIVVMDKNNKEDILAQAINNRSKDKVVMLRTFDPQGNSELEVPDPYYGDLTGFQEVFTIIKRSCDGLYNSFQS